MRGVLHGVRVLDLTGEPGFLAGKLLAELGADVVKVEPPGGDPARRRGPFWGGLDDPERSIPWLAQNDSKRGIVLDLAQPDDRDLFLALCDRADVVLETGRPGRLAELGLDWDLLHARHPRLVLCSITPWGQTGPWAGRRGSDLTVVAASGNLHCTGDPDRAPLRCSLPVSHCHASIEAAVGVAFALLAREQGGAGQHVDVAMQEAMVMPNIGTASMARMNGFRGARAGAFFRQQRSVQREIWRCTDGFVSFALRGGPARVPGLVAITRWMAEEGMASERLRAMDWRAYNHNLLSQDEVDALSAEFAAFFATKTMTELFVAACERNLMLAPANTAREILASAQLAARRFFVDVEHPGRGTLRLPGPFAIATSAQGDAPAIAVRGPAPRLGEHTVDVLAEITRRHPRDRGAAHGTGEIGALLAGTTILEFGGGAAGPVATRYFADHGATVVRVESRQRPDFLRVLRMTPDTKGGVDAGEHFAVLNANKLSVALDLSTPEGVAVARRLALRVDAIAENFAPGAMAKWGLDYASLARERPDLVMVSTCLNGQTGPQRAYPGFGGQGSALAGFNHLTGWPDREPLGPYGTITDSLSPRLAALLLATALLHRRRTGQGQHLDLSQVEGGVVCLGEMIATYTANGEILERRGNRARDAAPHGVFRCRDAADGRERWIAIAVHDDADWRRLVDAMGRPAWATDPSLGTVDGRLAAVDRVEAGVEDWTRDDDAAALAERLQDADVDAAAVLDLGDLHDDPQLAHRGHFRPVHHPVLGEHPAETHAIRFSAMAPALRAPAPRLGEHTEQVLRDLLAMPDDEIARLRAAGALE